MSFLTIHHWSVSRTETHLQTQIQCYALDVVAGNIQYFGANASHGNCSVQIAIPNTGEQRSITAQINNQNQSHPLTASEVAAPNLRIMLQLNATPPHQGLFHFAQMDVAHPNAGAPATGFVAQHREGEFLIQDFTKLVGIEKQASGRYKTRNIGFIDVQTRSMQQASTKCKAIQSSADPHFSLLYRTKTNPTEEWSARITPTMRECFGEIARVIDFAAHDIRSLQRFNLDNQFFEKLV